MVARKLHDLSAASMFKPLPGRYSKVGNAAAAAVASFFNSTCCSFKVASSCSIDLMRLSRSSARDGVSESKQKLTIGTHNNVRKIIRVIEPSRVVKSHLAKLIEEHYKWVMWR